MALPKRKDRFKPRADANLLSGLVQAAWKAHTDSIADESEQARVAEMIAQYFETKIPAEDFEVLHRYNCIVYHESCNVRVYDAANVTGPYAAGFGISLPRKVPVLGTGGFGYPALRACVPHEDKECVRELDIYFAGLLKMRKEYQAEYKASLDFPVAHKARTSEYPTWAEIEDTFPVLGTHVATIRKMDSTEIATAKEQHDQAI